MTFDWSFLILCYIVAVLLHEFGHWFYFTRELKKNVFIHFGKYNDKIRFFTGKEEDYKKLKPSQLRDIYLQGIGFGVIFLIIMLLFKQDQFVGLIVVGCAYLYSCMKDIAKAERASKLIKRDSKADKDEIKTI